MYTSHIAKTTRGRVLLEVLPGSEGGAAAAIFYLYGCPERPVTDEQQYPYTTHLYVKFPALALVDVPALVEACTDRWYNQTLCRVNDSVVRLGVMQGEYHWHKHDNDDEFFFVLEGHFIIDMEGRSIDLQPLEGFVVPKGVVHRTRAPDRAVILMVENATVVPTGDV
jgi:mannose-6-phosphate isomerase-like protein (cupin superfamily)